MVCSAQISNFTRRGQAREEGERVRVRGEQSMRATAAPRPGLGPGLWTESAASSALMSFTVNFEIFH